MEQLGALLFFGAVWLFILLPLSKLSKKKNKSSAGKGPGAETKAAGTPAEGEEAAGRRELRPAEPTVGIGLHDDSLYQGSLNAESTEGYDPCHDEQMAPLTRLSAEPVSPPVQPARPAPALQLSWTASDIVRGVVMSEILNRKRGPYDS